MKDRLFSVVNGQPIVTAPLINLSQFKKIWELDKSDDKHMYKSWLLYIYYMADYRSDFFELGSDEKRPKVLGEVFGRPNYRVPKRVENCVEVYRTRNTPAEQRALEGAIVSADSINKTLMEFQQDTKQLDKLVQLIEKEIKDAIKESNTQLAVDLMEQKLELQKKHMEIIKTSADLIPKVAKNVESIIELRDKVERAMKKIEESKQLVERFIVDEFIAKKQRGEYTVDND